MEAAKHRARRRHKDKPGNFINGYCIYELPGFALTAFVPEPARAFLSGLLGTPFHFTPIFRAGAILRLLESAVPVLISVFPLDSQNNPERAAVWFATTRAPCLNPLPGRPARLPDPEYLAQGKTPLGAVIALFNMQIKRKRWRVLIAPDEDGYWIDANPTK